MIQGIVKKCNVVSFEYSGGTHPSERRVVYISNVSRDLLGNIKFLEGWDFNREDWRRFAWDKVANLTQYSDAIVSDVSADADLLAYLANDDAAIKKFYSDKGYRFWLDKANCKTVKVKIGQEKFEFDWTKAALRITGPGGKITLSVGKKKDIQLIYDIGEGPVEVLNLKISNLSSTLDLIK